MKIILSIIFMFLSAHSFSGEIDKKGLDCHMTRLIDSKWLHFSVPDIYRYPGSPNNPSTWRAIFWFNNGRVEAVTSSRRPNNKKITPDDIGSRKYYTTDTTIGWHDLSDVSFEISRKKLTLTRQEIINSKKKVLVTGQCKVFTSFKVVKKRQKEFEKNYDEYEMKKKEEKRKAREGNKL